VFYGGLPIADNIKMLKGVKPPHIIVGTPGRILALTKKKDLDLSNLQILVIDECDKVLEATDMRSDVQQIYKNTPHQK